MSALLRSTELNFNLSVFQENEDNRWKFLEEKSSVDEDVGFLLRSPKPVVMASIAYIVFVKLLGPFLMKFREPFQLKSLIRFYNLIMVLVAGVLVIKVYNAVGSIENMFDCGKIFTFSDNSATEVYQMSNFILFVRLSEYLDTIFFTLRKKQNQVTFLHVFHHLFVPLYAYWILRTAPTRYNVFIILINSFIHVIMYFYYFLATFQERSSDPKQKKQHASFLMNVVNRLLMFKKYMTQMQILQFVLLAFYALSVIFRPGRCGVPWTYVIANLLLAFGFLSLFLHFYLTIYTKASKPSKTRRD